MSETTAIFYLGMILISSKIAGELFHRLHLPQVMGYLIVGLILGPYLGIIEASGQEIQLINYLAELGLIFLLFKIGLESNLRAMQAYGKTALAISLGGIIFSFLLALAWGFSGFLIHLDGVKSRVIFATIFIATSIGIWFLLANSRNVVKLSFKISY